MPASPAQIAASRANGLKSRGPVTEEGKATSRRNALKHGMAGSGVVVPEGDAAEVDRRSAAMLEEMRPIGELGRYLVRRLARLTVRVERCAEHELAAVDYRANHARAGFDEARLAEVDETIADVAGLPITGARRLRSTPEGVARLIAALLELREELNTGRWDWSYGDQVGRLTGVSWTAIPVTRVRALSAAIVGDFRHLLPSEGEGLSTPERVDWARNAMADLIDDELQSLLDHRATLDPEAIERDRAGAVDRSVFDPSREAILARRYEAASERAVYKALDEFRRSQAEAAPGDPAPIEVPGKEEDEAVDEAPGSFGAGDGSAPLPGGRSAPAPRMPRVPATGRASEGPPMPRSSGRGADRPGSLPE